MRQKSLIFLGLATAFSIAYLAVVARISVFVKPKNPLPSERNKLYVNGLQERPLKKFAYLTQTESCLYKYLQAPQQLGDSTKCQCDVLVLSYKKACEDSSLPHIQYIFDQNTSWTTGRNLLYRTIMKREQKYLYYTFFDDDITLNFREKPKEDLSPWREYEKALLQMRPHIGVSWEENIQNRFGKYYRGECNYTKKTDFLPYIWYDALFNTFHHEIINYLLPYCDEWDKVSIWYSQLYLIVKTDIMFPGQVLHHVNILARNPLHRPYARARYGPKQVQTALDYFIKKELPAKYLEQLQSKFKYWVKNVGKIESAGDQCPPFPTNISLAADSVVPFAHLNS